MNSFKRLNRALSTCGCAGTPSTSWGRSIAVLSISSGSKFSLQHRTTIASHHNRNTHMQRCTRRCSLCMCRNRREQLSHHYSLEQEMAQKKQNPAVLVSGLLCVCFDAFSSKDPIHNVIYCRKLYIHCLLKLLERKTEVVLIKSSAKKFCLLPPKTQKNKSGFTQVVKNYSPGN